MACSGFDSTCLDELDERSRLKEVSFLVNSMDFDREASSEIISARDLSLFDDGCFDLYNQSTEDDNIDRSRVNTTNNTMNDTTISTIVDDDNIKNWFIKYQNKDSDYKSLKLQFNHSKLQVQALTILNKNMKVECDSLKNALAMNEQDKLLLEIKLRDVISFETNTLSTSLTLSSTRSKSKVDKASLLDDIRGKLLIAANNRIEELTRMLHDRENTCDNSSNSAKDVELESDNRALRGQLHKLTEDLAQKIIIFRAHEKKWNDSNRINESYNLEQKNEISSLKIRIQQLESVNKSNEDAKIEKSTLLQESLLNSKQLNLLLDEAKTKIINLETEVFDANNSNRILQNTVDRLRGSDMETLEQTLLYEIESIKERFKANELNLRAEISDLKKLINTSDNEKERLIDEVQRLRWQLNLGANVSNNNAPNYNINTTIEFPDFQSVVDCDITGEEVNLEHNSTYVSVKSNGVTDMCMNDTDPECCNDTQFDTTVNEYVSIFDEDNTKFSALYDDHRETEDVSLNNFIESSVANFGLDQSFLIGNGDKHNSSIHEHDNQVQCNHDEELELVKMQLTKSQAREQDLKRKLSCVLHKASQLSLSPASSVQSSMDYTNLQSNIKSLNLEIDSKNSLIRQLEAEHVVLQEKISTYRDELYHLEMNQANQTHIEVIKATQEYELKVKSLENKIQKLQSQSAIPTIDQVHANVAVMNDVLKQQLLKADVKIHQLQMIIEDYNSRMGTESNMATADATRFLQLLEDIESKWKEKFEMFISQYDAEKMNLLEQLQLERQRRERESRDLISTHELLRDEVTKYWQQEMTSSIKELTDHYENEFMRYKEISPVTAKSSDDSIDSKDSIDVDTNERIKTLESSNQMLRKQMHEMRKQHDEQIILLTSLSNNRLDNDYSSRIQQIETKYEQQNQEYRKLLVRKYNNVLK